jgi:hypothetical protein
LFTVAFARHRATHGGSHAKEESSVSERKSLRIRAASFRAWFNANLIGNEDSIAARIGQLERVVSGAVLHEFNGYI